MKAKTRSGDKHGLYGLWKLEEAKEPATPGSSRERANANAMC